MTLNPADDQFRDILSDQLPEDVFRPLTPSYQQEPRGRFHGQGGILVAPRNTEQTAKIIGLCHHHKIGVVPYAGGTGLVGGQILPEGPLPVIVSMERMSAIRKVHRSDHILIAEAGAVLANVQAAAQGENLLFPLSLASEGTAQIGGLLATNAGGINVLRYGSARAQCLGLEAVLPDGSIWNGLRRLRKDNTGYDLRDLLIGSEGTLGIITAAVLQLAPVPAATGTALFATNSPQDALDVLAIFKAQIGDNVSAFELIDRQGLEFQIESGMPLRKPFDTLPDWLILVEIGLPAGLEPQQTLGDLFETAHSRGLVNDGLIAQTGQQERDFWKMREGLPEANRRVGSVSNHDISVPLSDIAEFKQRADREIAELGEFRINCFGHLGDGNLHYNVFPPAGRSATEYVDIRDQIRRLVHEIVHDFGGSISAEHGIGRLKRADLQHFGDPTKLSAMRAIKSALDPIGIMNPGAVLA